MRDMDNRAYQKIKQYCLERYFHEAGRLARTIKSPTIRDCAETHISNSELDYRATFFERKYNGGRI